MKEKILAAIKTTSKGFILGGTTIAIVALLGVVLSVNGVAYDVVSKIVAAGITLAMFATVIYGCCKKDTV